MEYSFDKIKDKKLTEIIIPGTHNSNTYTFDSYLNWIVKN